MNSIVEEYNELLEQGLQSWKEAVEQLYNVDIDWSSPHPSLGMNLDVFDSGLTTVYEMAGNFKRDMPDGMQAMLQITPAFHSLRDSLVKLRDSSNAIKDYFKIAIENNHKVTVLDINRLNDGANRQLNLADYLKQMKTDAGNFSGQIMALKDFVLSGEIQDLTKRIDDYRKLAGKIKSVHANVKKLLVSSEEYINEIEKSASGAKSNLEDIQKISTSATEAKEKADAATVEINAKLAAIRETSSQGEKLTAIIEQYQAKYEAFDDELESRNKLFIQFKQNNTNAQEQNKEREQEVDRIISKSDQMLKGATNAGLATAFNNASTKYGEEALDAKSAFYWAVGFLILSVIPLATYVLPFPAIELLGIEGIKTGDIKFGGILARAILMIPTVWLTTFAGHRYWALFQLHREYSFKAAIAMSVEGFKEQSKNYEQEIAGATFVGLSEKPEYTPSNESSKSPNPIMDYLIRVIQKRFGKMSGSE